MEAGDELQLLPRIGRGEEVGFDPGVDALEVGVDGRAQDVVLALEVEIDGTVGDAGAGRDGAYRRVKIAVLGDDGDGSVEDTLVFFTRGLGVGVGRFGCGSLQAMPRSAKTLPSARVMNCGSFC
jgi:hypothetical protein